MTSLSDPEIGRKLCESFIERGYWHSHSSRPEESSFASTKREGRTGKTVSLTQVASAPCILLLPLFCYHVLPAKRWLSEMDIPVRRISSVVGIPERGLKRGLLTFTLLLAVFCTASAQSTKPTSSDARGAGQTALCSQLRLLPRARCRWRRIRSGPDKFATGHARRAGRQN